MLKREYEDDGLSVFTDHGLAALVWRAAPTEQRVAIVEPILEACVRRHPNGFGVVVVIGESVSLPSLSLRDRIVAVLRKITSHVKTVAWVVPSEGFQSSLVRSLLTALFVMLRPSFKPQTFQSVREALAYVIAGTGRAEPSDLAAVTAQIEASVRAAGTRAVG